MIHVKRVYDPVATTDGDRFLVDRLWPRGIRRDAICLAGWAKELAPSDRLRRRYHAGGISWAEFQQDYIDELEAEPSLWAPYVQRARHATVTLLVAARDPLQNHGLVLREFLIRKIARETGEHAEA